MMTIKINSRLTFCIDDITAARIINYSHKENIAPEVFFRSAILNGIRNYELTGVF